MVAGHSSVAQQQTSLGGWGIWLESGRASMRSDWRRRGGREEIFSQEREIKKEEETAYCILNTKIN